MSIVSRSAGRDAVQSSPFAGGGKGGLGDSGQLGQQLGGDPGGAWLGLDPTSGSAAAAGAGVEWGEDLWSVASDGGWGGCGGFGGGGGFADMVCY
jgi:hypothetical protein